MTTVVIAATVLLLGYLLGRLRHWQRLGDWASDQIRFAGSFVQGGAVRQTAVVTAYAVTHPRARRHHLRTPRQDEPVPLRDPHWADDRARTYQEQADHPDRARNRGATAPSPTAVDVEHALLAAEHIFHTLVRCPANDRDASAETLAVVLTAIREEERPGYLARLEDFADQRRERLEQLYRKFGPNSAIAAHGRYTLAGRPESIIICERLDSAPRLLAGIWDDELPEQPLADLAEAWGVPIRR